MGWANHHGSGSGLLVPSRRLDLIKQQPGGRSQLNQLQPPATGHLMTMLHNLLTKEKQLIKPKFAKTNENKIIDLRNEERDPTVNWLFTVKQSFKFHPETFALAVSILDSFLLTVKVRGKYLKCVAITSLFLALKITEEEEEQPGCDELVERSRCGCTRSDVLRMERLMLDKLSWNINLPTALDFLHLFHTMAITSGQVPITYLKVSPTRQLTLLTRKLEGCLTHSTPSSLPSTLALSLLSLEWELYSPTWLKTTLVLQKLIGLSNEHLIRCREICGRYLAGEPGLDTTSFYYRRGPPGHLGGPPGHLGGPEDHKVGPEVHQTGPLAPRCPNVPPVSRCKPPTKYSSYSAAVTAGNKRKVPEEMDDIYDSIKRLYN